MNWDKELTAKLFKDIVGLTREQVGTIIGIIAEHRQIADREGYKRGYIAGYKDAEIKFQK